MTLVVTEVSEKFGCVVVGDTAVTVMKGGAAEVFPWARKVHYAAKPKIGFAIWGNACLGNHRLDEFVSDFAGSLSRTESPRSAGQNLAAALVDEGKNDGRPWKELRGGVHVCGYQNGTPVLFHVHTGHRENPQGPYQLHEDCTDASRGYHLRNGYYEMFGILFDQMQKYVVGLRQQLGFTWPDRSVEDRVSYHSMLVETVAKTLVAAGQVPAVGNLVSAFAFNRDGLVVNKRLRRSRQSGNFCAGGGSLLASFGEQPN
jgi:hypothetical protein